MALAVPSEKGDTTEKSLAALIASQFTQYDVYNVIGHTEIPKRELKPIVTLLSLQRTEEILSTPFPKRSHYGDTEEAQLLYESEKEKFRLKLMMLLNPDAMISTVLYGWLFYYGLCMRSLDRKIRVEGVKLGSASMARKEEEEGQVGLSAKLLHSLGLGRLTPYKKAYTRREE